MKRIAFLHNLRQLLISLDQLLQVIIGCIVSLVLWDHRIDADETMSAYCHRHNKYWYGRAMEILVNCLMYIPEKLIYKLPWGIAKGRMNRNVKAYIGEVLLIKLRFHKITPLLHSFPPFV